MIKLRNVIILFILAWMIIDVGDFVTERVTISNAARTTSVYSRIAAECALKSATMSDDFFTAGVTDNQTYNESVKKISSGVPGIDNISFVSDASGYRMASLNSNDSFEILPNPYVALYNDEATFNRSKVDFADACFARMYSESDAWASWASNIFDCYREYDVNSDDPTDLTAVFPRSVIWTDTLFFTSSSGDMVTGPVQGTVQIPKLLTMGAELFTDTVLDSGLSSGIPADDDNVMDNYTRLSELFERTQLNTTSEQVIENTVNTAYEFGMSAVVTRIQNQMRNSKYGDMRFSPELTPGAVTLSALYTLDDEPDMVTYNRRYRNLLGTADYWSAKRTTSINRDGTVDGDWSASVEHGVSNGTGNLYFYYTPTSVGMTYLDPSLLNMLYRNNMDLLMRAKYLNADGESMSDYKSYVYTDKSGYYNDYEYNNATADDEFARTYVNNGIFYYKRGNLRYDSNGSGDTLHYYDLDGTRLSNPKIEYLYIDVCDAINGSGADLQTNAAINTMLQRAISPNVNLSSLASTISSESSSYELVVAKVTFESDFIFPYKTKTMRGMAEHFEDDTPSDLHALVIDSSSGTTGNAMIDSALNGQSGSFSYELGSDGDIHCYYTTYYCVSLGGYQVKQ